MKLKKFVRININDKKKFNKIKMNGKNPNSFEPKNFGGVIKN